MIMAKLEPTQLPTVTQSKYGFHDHAETLNGRAAMVGFAAMVLLEYFSGRGVLSLLGLH